MTFSAKVLKDSVSPFGRRVTTMELCYPRAVHAELLTHRTFSRNAASSRAIPIQKMLSRVWNNPMKPVWWGKNQSGMQAKEELTGFRLFLAQFVWFVASRFECFFAWLLFKIGLHKQIANRRLECDGWITVIVTATEWDNFFALRTHPDAQPELQHIAKMAKSCYDESIPALLEVGDWHLPLVDDFEKLLHEGFSINDIVKICAGRCARVSYLTHDGKRDPNADIQLYERLLNSGHMSPMEHPAQVPDASEAHKRFGNFVGFRQHRKMLPFEADFGSRPRN